MWWGTGTDVFNCNDVLLATGVNRMLLTTQTGSYTRCDIKDCGGGHHRLKPFCVACS